MKFAAIATSLLLASTAAFAEEPPHTYALVSAIGSTLSYVKPRFSTGTHMEPWQRAELKVPNKALDAAALRGLENVVRASDPAARFVYLRLNPDEYKDVDGPFKGEVAVGKLASAFERMPERKDWYRILVVTPRYVANERAGMGAKLSGIGIYVQTMERSMVAADGSTIADPITDDPDIQGTTPDGKPLRIEGAFVAPFFYTKLWVIDAQTLQVLNTSERFDAQKIRDPTVAATRIEAEVPPEKLGPIVETFVEQASTRAAQNALGVVTVGEPKVVKPK